MFRLGVVVLVILVCGIFYFSYKPVETPSGGYVEAVSRFVPYEGDTYSIDGSALRDNAYGKIDALVIESTGQHEIDVTRSGQTYQICRPTVKENSVTSVTLEIRDNTIRCIEKN